MSWFLLPILILASAAFGQQQQEADSCAGISAGIIVLAILGFIYSSVHGVL